MRRRRWILIILILILVSAILFMPSYGWDLRRWLSPNSPNGGGDINSPNLAAENDQLNAEVATYATIASQLPQSREHYIRAMVYSRYPLNFKNEILVNAGSADGVATGTAVLYQGMLMGRVADVYLHEALIKTIFDSSFEMPVRMGTASYDGLFEGGSYPKVGSIVKTAVLGAGDIIYSAAPGLPYGVPLGEVSATTTSADSLFMEAAVTFPYDINDVQTVMIAQAS